MWCVVCDLETSWMRRTVPLGGGAVEPKTNKNFCVYRSEVGPFDHHAVCFISVLLSASTSKYWHSSKYINFHITKLLQICCTFHFLINLCVGLITRPDESYRLWCVWVWSQKPREWEGHDPLRGGEFRAQNKQTKDFCLLGFCLTVHHQLGKVIKINQLDATMIYWSIRSAQHVSGNILFLRERILPIWPSCCVLYTCYALKFYIIQSIFTQIKYINFPYNKTAPNLLQFSFLNRTA